MTGSPFIISRAKKISINLIFAIQRIIPAGRRTTVKILQGKAGDVPNYLDKNTQRERVRGRARIRSARKGAAVIEKARRILHALRQAPLSSVDERPMRRASLAQLRQLLAEDEIAGYEASE